MIGKVDVLFARPRPVLARPPVPEAASSGLNERVVTLIVSLAITACVALTATSAGLISSAKEQPVRIVTLLALTLALQMFSVQVYGRGSVSVSAIGIVASAFLFDTGTTMVIAVLAAVTQSVRRKTELHKAVFDASNFAISAGAASLVFQALHDWRFPAAVLAGAVFAVVNNGLLCLVMSFAERIPWRTVWFERFHWARFHFALFGPLALAATIAYEQVGVAGLVASRSRPR